MGCRRAAIAFGSALCLSAAAEPQTPPAPGAFELLGRMREAYAALESYRDLGEIEQTVEIEGREQTIVTFFETAAEGGRFQWRCHRETPEGFEERIVWSDGSESFVYSSLYRQHKRIPSLASELAHGLGAGGYEALVVPLLLAGVEDVLSEPEAAAVAGPEACGEGSCWVISLSRMGGTIETELTVDRDTYLIRRLEVKSSTGADVLRAAAADAGLPVPEPDAPSPRGSTLTVRHHPEGGSAAAFGPPDGSRRVAEWQPETIDEEKPLIDLGFGEAITVALYTLPVRIVDSTGAPVRGLEPDDLMVEIGAEKIPVLALDFATSQGLEEMPAGDESAPARSSATRPAAEPGDQAGKLVVFFLQVDLEPTRIAGHLKLLPDLEDLLDSLHPDDRVAVFSFDSRLKLWQDSTRDRATAFDALRRAISHGEPPPERSSSASLAEHLDVSAAADAASPERALQVTAEALAAVPGVKDLVYVGWGLGRFDRGGVRMTADYAPAVRSLESAQATVFVLDVTQADNHSLEVGLQSVAAHTGGTYERTFHFASQAVHRLARTLGGFYQVTIDRSRLPGARGRLKITLKDEKGRVLYRPTIFG